MLKGLTIAPSASKASANKEASANKNSSAHEDADEDGATDEEEGTRGEGAPVEATPPRVRTARHKPAPGPRPPAGASLRPPLAGHYPAAWS